MFRKILFLLLALSLLVSPLSAGGNRWTSKPPLGSTIDWSHPLSKGLVTVWLMNEGAGLRANNLVRPLNYGVLENGAYFKTINQSGIYCDGTNDSITTPNAFPNSANGTVVLYFKMLTHQNGTNVNTGLWTNFFTTSSGYLFFTTSPDDFPNEPNKLAFGIHTGSVSKEKISVNQIYSNTVYMVVGVWKTGTGLYLFKNGKSLGSTLDVGVIAPTETDVPQIANYYTLNTERATNIICYYAMSYNRALSSQEIQTLYQDPYCFIKPPTIWSNFKTAVEAVRRVIFIE